LYCATSNLGKMREFRMAAGPGIEIEPVPGFAEIPPCPEDGATFEENAVLKARHYGVHAPGLLFADDSGLEVDALDGAPGVYSARFAGIAAGDEANNRLLLDKMRNAMERAARFVCVLALVDGESLIDVFRGSVEGEIASERRGQNGFGYDPLFYYPSFGCTFGEISAERKFSISHRGKALRAMAAALARGKSQSRC
jgi:XTP/dITP diphosphohydrolase